MKKIKEEKASVSVYVFIVLFTYLIILSSIYFTLISIHKAQLKTILKIKQSYELDNGNIEQIYQSKINTEKEPEQKEFIFDYTGTEQTFTAPASGIYKLQVWGAQGGQGGPSNLGGKGGYSTGNITLTKGQSIYVYVGGQGIGATTTSTTTKENAGGYNGGGSSYQVGTGGPRGSGGGATDIRFVPNTDPLNSSSLLSRVIVAGGGGGSLYYNNTSYTSGVGGGTSGTNGTVGKGGTQTAGGSGYEQYVAAGFGYGGYKSSNSTSTIAGGGGGWYGGGAGNAAGGGSGFIWTSATASNVPSGYSVETKYYLTEASTIAGNAEFDSPTGTKETGHAGNGYAKITWLRFK